MKASERAFDRIKEAFELGSTGRGRKYEHCARDHESEVLTICGVSSRSLEDKEESQCLTCARSATVFLWKTTLGGSLGETYTLSGAQFVERSMTGSNRTGFGSCKQVIVFSRPRYSKHMQYFRAFVQI